MVKPLNKEWEFFGKKYRVDGAKGEKVDCNACHKQVSAAVNRLQSHLRICPARTQLQLALSAPTTIAASSASELEDPQLAVHGATQSHSDALTDGASAVPDGILLRQFGRPVMSPATPMVASSTSSSSGVGAGINPLGGGVALAAPAAKRFKSSPSTNRARGSWVLQGEEFGDTLVNGTHTAMPSETTLAFAKRRLEIEEKRLELEKKRNQREEKRDLYELIILKAQAQKEQWIAEKERYEARVALALARKQLRDQGIGEEEINMILPIGKDSLAVEPARPAVSAPATPSSSSTSVPASGKHGDTVADLPDYSQPSTSDSSTATAATSSITAPASTSTPASAPAYSALSSEEIKASDKLADSIVSDNTETDNEQDHR